MSVKCFITLSTGPNPTKLARRNLRKISVKPWDKVYAKMSVNYTRKSFVGLDLLPLRIGQSNFGLAIFQNLTTKHLRRNEEMVL